MIRPLTYFAALAGLLAATAAQAQTAPPPQSWTGFYIGAQLGGAWGDRSVSYLSNDPAIARILGGTSSPPTSRPAPGHDVSTSGVTGGITFGYNWQTAPRWLAGIEIDVSASDIRGTGSSEFALAADITQTLKSEQRIDWWGTVRGRLGMLTTRDLLLFGTAGLAYGRVINSNVYSPTGTGTGDYSSSAGGFSIRCTPNTDCAAGLDASVKGGWTVGVAANGTGRATGASRPSICTSISVRRRSSPPRSERMSRVERSPAIRPISVPRISMCCGSA